MYLPGKQNLGNRFRKKYLLIKKYITLEIVIENFELPNSHTEASRENHCQKCKSIINSGDEKDHLESEEYENKKKK